VRAFEVEALDYLLKPFDRDRFLSSIARVRAALAEPDRGEVEERLRRLLADFPGRPAPTQSAATDGVARPVHQYRSFDLGRLLFNSQIRRQIVDFSYS
jgi:DNA-binding LytR/AlgR family response regulator